MSEHRITLNWSRSSPDFEYKTYNRSHAVTFKNDQSLRMSAALAYKGDADLVDPEEAFVASLSSCHMLTFLAIAARRGIVVDHYADTASGYLEKNADNRLAITRVILRPRITFGRGSDPDEASLHALHEEAHHHCFIANSVVTEITVESNQPSSISG
jgi:organic hydroperoxide reductase OsmC/OhrA